MLKVYFLFITFSLLIKRKLKCLSSYIFTSILIFTFFYRLLKYSNLRYIQLPDLWVKTGRLLLHTISLADKALLGSNSSVIL